MATERKWSVGEIEASGQRHRIWRLTEIEQQGLGEIARLPRSIRVLLENLLRREDGGAVPASDIEALAGWQPNTSTPKEIAFMPGRVLLQDFTGVPAVVDLAAMRDAMAAMEGKGVFRDLLAADEVVSEKLSTAELSACFDLRHHLRHANTIMDRAFGDGA